MIVMIMMITVMMMMIIIAMMTSVMLAEDLRKNLSLMKQWTSCLHYKSKEVNLTVIPINVLKIYIKAICPVHINFQHQQSNLLEIHT